MQRSRAGEPLAALLVAVGAMVMVAGTAEGQNLPVRVSIGARATVLPLPSPAMISVDSTRTAPLLTVTAPADSTALAGWRRQRRLVVSYPGT